MEQVLFDALEFGLSSCRNTDADKWSPGWGVFAEFSWGLWPRILELQFLPFGFILFQSRAFEQLHFLEVLRLVSESVFLLVLSTIWWTTGWVVAQLAAETSVCLSAPVCLSFCPLCSKSDRREIRPEGNEGTGLALQTNDSSLVASSF